MGPSAPGLLHRAGGFEVLPGGGFIRASPLSVVAHCVRPHLLLHSPLNGHLGGFHLVAVVDDAAMNIHTLGFVSSC